ncbi:MAG TPA: hypothetical protein VHL80_02880 [Polyangia bacterium]|nr:hypothetical protein [Polyangia bacterium]
MTVFETETMAELCVKQGLVTEALAIYRRLVEGARDGATRERRATRLAELERMARDVVRARGGGPASATAAGAPSLTVERRASALRFAWTLPPETRDPALQLLLVRRGPGGVETESRTLRLEGARGSTTVEAAGLHAVHAAVGWLDGARFVPLARLAA